MNRPLTRFYLGSSRNILIFATVVMTVLLVNAVFVNHTGLSACDRVFFLVEMVLYSKMALDMVRSGKRQL